MEAKTIKLAKGKGVHTDLNEMKQMIRDHDLCIFSGARGAGKSYPSASYVDDYLKENLEGKFFYCRISKNELATFYSWCKDIDLKGLCGCDNFKLERGKPTKGDITLTGFDEDDKVVYERTIGKCMSLENSADYKSGNYSEFDVFIFEEFARNKMNPNNEKTYVFNFLENIVSIFRDRPKTVVLISNVFNNIPLLERAIDELTLGNCDEDEAIFINPIKVKIYKDGNRENSFLSYMHGEVYDADNFKPKIDECRIIFTDKEFVIYQHMVYHKRFYVTNNKAKKNIIYRELEYIILKNFCRNSAVNEFFYQNSSIERDFIKAYDATLCEITRLLALQGARYLL